MHRNRGSDESIHRIFREGTLIDEAVQAAAREAIRRHRQAGARMAFWEAGQVIWIDPAELEQDLES